MVDHDLSDDVLLILVTGDQCDEFVLLLTVVAPCSAADLAANIDDGGAVQAEFLLKSVTDVADVELGVTIRRTKQPPAPE